MMFEGLRKMESFGGESKFKMVTIDLGGKGDNLNSKKKIKFMLGTIFNKWRVIYNLVSP